MKTQLPSGRSQPRFSGIATFLRVPRATDVAGSGAALDWALFGVPFDGGVTFRPGARFGPRAVREASQYIKPYSIEQRVHVAERLSLADAGDAPVSPYSCEQTSRMVTEFACGLGDPATTRLLAVGGDHSVAYANIRATWQRRGRPAGGLALVHFDAHMDTVDEVWGERYGHASPFRRAIEDGCVDAKAMISIGIRGSLNTPDDLAFAKDHGVTVVTMDDWRRTGAQTLAAFLARVRGRETYLSFDVDAVDPAFCPGTGTPVCGGFSSAEALGIVRALRGEGAAPILPLVGADIVEVLPDRDPAGITSMFAAQLMLEVLALSA